MRKQIVTLLVFVFVLGSDATFNIPLMVGGDVAIEAVTRFMIFFAAGATYLMAGLHSGFRRQTPHTPPEYERIVEVLDVPEDIYLKRKDLQRLPQIPPDMDPSKVPLRLAKRRKNISDRKGLVRNHNEVPPEPSPIVTPPSFLARMLGMVVKLKAKVPCSELKVTSKLYKQNCVPKPNHSDVISFMYPHYRNWKHTAATERRKSRDSSMNGGRRLPPRIREE